MEDVVIYSLLSPASGGTVSKRHLCFNIKIINAVNPFFLTQPSLSQAEELTTDYMQVVDRSTSQSRSLCSVRCGFQESADPFVEPRLGRVHNLYMYAPLFRRKSGICLHSATIYHSCWLRGRGLRPVGGMTRKGTRLVQRTTTYVDDDCYHLNSGVRVDNEG